MFVSLAKLRRHKISTRTTASIQHGCSNKRPCGVNINCPIETGLMIWVTSLSQDRKLLFGANRKALDIFSLISIFKLIVLLGCIEVKLMFRNSYLDVRRKLNFNSRNTNIQNILYQIKTWNRWKKTSKNYLSLELWKCRIGHFWK